MNEANPAITPQKITDNVNSLTRSELVAVLDSEIKLIEDENRRPGWSAWALQGGIATFFWLSLSEYSPKTNWHTVAIVFLFGSLFGDFLLGTCQYFHSFGNSKLRQLRYRFSSDNPSISVGTLTFFLARHGGLLAVYLLLDPACYVPSFILYCALTLVVCLFALLTRFMKLLPLSKGMPTKYQHALIWIPLLWSGILSYEIFKFLPFSDTSYKTADFRIGFLLVGIVYLFWLLTTGERERPILNSLKIIRRELAFGNVTVQKAAKDADTALSGLTAAAAINHKLTELLTEFQRVIVLYEKLAEDCHKIDTLLKDFEMIEVQNVEKRVESARKIAILLDDCETKRLANQQLFNTVFYRTKSSIRSIEGVISANATPMPETAEKWQDVRQKMGKMFDLSNACAPMLEDLKARYLNIPLSGN